MRHILGYILIITICGTTIALILAKGRSLERHVDIRHISPDLEGNNGIAKTLHENLHGSLAILLIQVVVIVLVSKVLGRAAASIGQPQVVGEMIGGILLGPSFLGQISPALMNSIFPAASMDTLSMFSQVGVIIFMFLVGMEVDIQHLFRKAHTAVLVSHVSIILPFLLGTTLSFTIYRMMAPPGVSFTEFALFMGVAMSITAFPVLARIVEERELMGSNLGVMSLGCAAIGDVTAWCILALVLAIVKSNGFESAVLTVFLVVVYASVMMLLVKPLLKKLEPAGNLSSEKYSSLAALILAFALAAGLVTELIGVHALFGAFLAGVIIPAGHLRSFCKERFESVASGLLLPLFFVFTGLRTEIGLLNSLSAWLVFAGVIVAAIAGKLGGSTLAARWSGMKWRDSFALGALMNTRGLMELIVLNIGRDLGILSPQIFAILVLMAITTTIMTSPLLEMASRYRAHT